MYLHTDWYDHLMYHFELGDWRWRCVFFNDMSDPKMSFHWCADRNMLRSLHFILDEVEAGDEFCSDARLRAWFCSVARRGHVDVIRILVKRLGLNAEKAHTHKAAAFREAAFHGHVDVLRYIVSEFKFNKKDAQSDSNMAFVTAATNGHVDVLEFMMRRLGFTIQDARYPRDGAIRGAAHMGELKVIKFFVKKMGFTKKDVLYGVDDAFTAVLECQQVHVLDYFVRQFDLQWTDCKPYFLWAIERDLIVVIKYFVERMGTDVQKSIEDALNTAATHGYMDIVAYLSH
jgi:hypothetical protein